MNLNKVLVLEQTEPVYVVNKEEGTVKCNVWAGFRVRDPQDYRMMALINILKMLTNFDRFDCTGQAKLAEGDVWDEELGKKIAYLDSQIKATQALATWCEKAATIMSILADTLYDEADRYDLAWNKNVDFYCQTFRLND